MYEVQFGTPQECKCLEVADHCPLEAARGNFPKVVDCRTPGIMPVAAPICDHKPHVLRERSIQGLNLLDEDADIVPRVNGGQVH